MKSVIITKDSRVTTPLVFLFFLLVMLGSSGGHLDVWDGKGYFLLTENIVKHHSLILYPDLVSPDNGTDFSVRKYFSWQHELRHGGEPLPQNARLEPTPSNASPLFALLGVPFYVIADTIHYSTVKLTSYLLNSLILSFTCTVVFAFGSVLYRSKKIGFVLSLIVGVCSFAWPYVSSYFEQPLSALILISCLYFLFIASRTQSVDPQGYNLPTKVLKVFPLLAGLFLGLQSFAHAGTIIVVPGVALIAGYLLWRDKAKLYQFFGGLAFFAGLQLAINKAIFGSITEFGYGFNQNLTHTSTQGLYGLFLSPGSGLLVYFPIIALIPIAVYYLWKQNKLFCIAFLYVFLSIWAFYGTLPAISEWTGLGCWGPRYMLTTIPVLALMLGSILSALSSKLNLSRTNMGYVELPSSGTVLNALPPQFFKNILKVLFVILAFAGFITNLLGVLVWYQIGFSYGYGPLHVNKLPDTDQYFVWHPEYSLLLLNWKVLTTDYWKTPDLYPLFDGWAPCIPDNFLYCNFGILSSMALLIPTVSTALLIINILFRTKEFK